MINKPKHIAKLSGLLYLLLVPFGFFGMMYVPSQIVLPGDMTATMNNIVASQSMFRLSMASSFLMNIDVIVLGLVLYKLLKQVEKNIAILMVVLVLFGACISMISELNHFAVLFLNSSESIAVFTEEQSQQLVRLFLGMRQYGSAGIAGIFWGLWLFPLGYLVFKSNFIPKLFGILLIIAGAYYILASFVMFLAPHYDVSFLEFTAYSELLFALWLLIKGVDVAKWNKLELKSMINK